jgi:parallel beta-helix repeat protein
MLVPPAPAWLGEPGEVAPVGEPAPAPRIEPDPLERARTTEVAPPVIPRRSALLAANVEVAGIRRSDPGLLSAQRDHLLASDFNATLDHTDGWVDVRSFGAKGDGVTDDTAAIQAAVNAAAGRTLVAQGTFKLGQVTIVSNATYDFRGAKFLPASGIPVPDGVFVGDGVTNVTFLGGWWIPASFTPTAPDTKFGPYPTTGTSWANGQFGGVTGIWLRNSSHVVIDGGRFDGLWTGVNLYDTSHAQVTRTIHTGGIAGIAVIASFSGSVVTDVKVDHNQIIGCGDDGIAVMTQSPAGGGRIEHVQVEHNFIDKSRLGATPISGIGIRVENSLYGPVGTLSGISVSGNTLKDMVAGAIEVGNLSDSTVSNNTVIGYSKVSASAYTIGIAEVSSVDHIRVLGNRASSSVTNDAPAMTVSEASHTEITANQLNGNSSSGGLAVHNAAYNLFSGNMISNPGGPGIVSTGGSDHNIVTGNDLSAATSPYSLVGTDNALSANKGAALGTDVTGLHPGTDGNAAQRGSIYQGSGVPSNSNGSNGDVYFRTDAPGTANQRIYIKSAGSWVGIL